MNFTVYIKLSEVKNRYEIGFTSDVDDRLKRHNQKSIGFTGNVDDCKLVYTEIITQKKKPFKES